MRSLEFDLNALEDLIWWLEKDRKIALKILKLAESIMRNPHEGIGKPEPLKGNFSGLWSRRIDKEHRLIYDVQKDKIRILACRYHYE
jgi:toxin YoeB